MDAICDVTGKYVCRELSKSKKDFLCYIHGVPTSFGCKITNSVRKFNDSKQVKILHLNICALIFEDFLMQRLPE